MASQQQLSEEELRQYVAQVREAPVADLLTQAYTMLGAWAEAKLGRGDARALIDGLSGLVQAAASGLPANLAKQMRDGIGQLQLLQVQAEQQLAAREQPSASASQGASGAQAGEPRPTREPPPEKPMTDRLWIPGRDPRPR
ncbi:MAG: hypothetical protein ACRDZO_20715 [Egibacteraceae bacterium]